eukprot:c12409_g1_i2.p1 GENE.c12409_g1_i2~~c12409_g1_i2.p1  ORF type:complete len:613 (+),score=128.92 c12409_g1_i2:50-1888(+)
MYFWLLWVAVGSNAILSSAGVHWAISQITSLFFFFVWCCYNLNPSFVLRSAFSEIVGAFFKDFDVAGMQRVPLQGPVIFACAPHNNQFLDALVVMKSTFHRKDTKFITAAATMRRKYVGTLAHILGGIPVERSEDVTFKGQGTISISGSSVIGSNTAFTTQCTPGCVLVSSGDNGAPVRVKVHDVVDDAHITLEAPLEQVTVTTASFTIQPRIDHSAMFKEVYDSLGAGGAVVIFPEGGSHDRTELLPLKLGVSTMALGAMAAKSDLKVQIVPVGINYFKGHRFRSRVFVDIGAPIVPSEDLVKSFAQGGEARKIASEELLHQVYAGICAVTIAAPDYTTLQFFRAMRRLYLTPVHDAPTPIEKFSLTHVFAKNYKDVKNDPRVKDLFEKVLTYRNHLKQQSIPDYVIATLCQQDAPQPRQNHTSTQSLLLLRRIVLSVVFALFAIPGQVLAAPMVVTTRYISKKEAAKALRKSKVKLEGRDVVATWKLLVSFVMVPLMHVAYTTLCFILTRSTTLTITYFFMAPFVAGTSVLATERGLKEFAAIKPVLAGLVKKNVEESLVNERRALQKLIRQVVTEIGWVADLPRSNLRQLSESLNENDLANEDLEAKDE